MESKLGVQRERGEWVTERRGKGKQELRECDKRKAERVRVYHYV